MSEFDFDFFWENVEELEKNKDLPHRYPPLYSRNR